MLNAIFAGTPELAAQILQNLLQTKNINILACLTTPDKPTGRGRKIAASPVKQIALTHNIPVHQPTNLKDNFAHDLITSLKADVVIVVAYGLIIPANLLALPKYGWLNVHMSLLPRWRGAAPIQHAILNGDPETGVTIMQMDATLDTGDILAIEAFPITAQDTCASLANKMALIGTTELISVLVDMQAGTLNARKQNSSKACYATKINKQDGKINWQQPALQIDRQIRACNPAPIAFTQAESTIIRVFQAELANHELAAKVAPGTILTATKHGIEVAASDSSLNLQILQLAGKNPLTAGELVNAKHKFLAPGSILQ